MDKFSGIGGWRRQSGTALQEVRSLGAERALVLRNLQYLKGEKNEENVLKDYVRRKQARKIEAMTSHLHEWTDQGSKHAPELNRGSRSLGASICRILPTASLAPKRKTLVQQADKALVGSPKAQSGRNQGLLSAPNGAGTTSESCVAGEDLTLSWNNAMAMGEQVMYLSGTSAAREGFAELKEAVLLAMLQGEDENTWRRAVEDALHMSVWELDMPAFYAGAWLSAERKCTLDALMADLRSALDTRHELGGKQEGRVDDAPPNVADTLVTTSMISKINPADEVDRIEDLLDEELRCKPVDAHELFDWKLRVSLLEKRKQDALRKFDGFFRQQAGAQQGRLLSMRPNTSNVYATPLQESDSIIIAERDVKTSPNSANTDQLLEAALIDMDAKPQGSTLRSVGRSRTPTPVMTHAGLFHAKAFPDAGRRRQ